MQRGRGGRGKSTELYEVKQQALGAGEKKMKLLMWQINQLKKVARCAKASFSSLAALRDKVWRKKKISFKDWNMKPANMLSTLWIT